MNRIPVFAGRTDDGELYVLYKDGGDEVQFPSLIDDSDRRVKRPEEFSLMLPTGELWALAPGTKINWWMDADVNFSYMKIQSQVWTGELRGSRLDLIEAKIIDRSGMRDTY